MFSCQRCGYSTEFKCNLVSHLKKKHPCVTTLSEISQAELLDVLIDKSRRKFSCSICNRQFADRSYMYKHQRQCKQQPLRDEIAQIAKVVKELTDKNNKEEQSNKNEIERLKQEVMYYKHKKRENHYQTVLEGLLQGTHKILRCGVTDISTDNMHAEIKEWKSWKEAVGQLLCYNAEDPKPTLSLYFFGSYTQSLKEYACQIIKSYGINVYECIDSDSGLLINSLTRNTDVVDETNTQQIVC